MSQKRKIKPSLVIQSVTMTNLALLERLAEVLDIDASSISPSTPLTSHNWDSVALLGTIAVVDELFEVVVPANELQECKTVAEVIALIERLVEP